MGYVHATIALSNPRLPELDPLPVSARADSGALMLCIPAALGRPCSSSRTRSER